MVAYDRFEQLLRRKPHERLGDDAHSSSAARRGRPLERRN
jgi:hypothetical protein